MEGECGADAEVNTGWKAMFIRGDPVFLLRATEANPDQIGPGAADFFSDGFKFLCGPLAEWRRVATGNGDTGKARGEAYKNKVLSFSFSCCLCHHNLHLMTFKPSYDNCQT